MTYSIQQRRIDASGRRNGKVANYKSRRSIRSRMPKELPELAPLGRSLGRRRMDASEFSAH
ncbi:hypothetical protein [Dietzia sp. 2505]|uniref:hypothetical protein n=1 Tax=Dietzia sp. 2505 TaxID=3156457 RepID=UPI003399E76A